MSIIETNSKGRVSVDTSRDVFLQREHMVDAVFSGLRGGDFESLACIFERCDFSNMRPRRTVFASGLEPTLYSGCRFDGSKFKKVVGGIARFEKCSFLDVEIDGLFGHAIEFVDCVFSGVLRRTVFFGRVGGTYAGLTTRTVNEFLRNDFSAAEFHDVSFREGIDLAQQRLPRGDAYLYLNNARERLASLRKKYIEQPPSERREAIFAFLSRAEQKLRAGQDQLFLCKDSEPFLSRQTADVIWEELGQDNVPA